MSVAQAFQFLTQLRNDHSLHSTVLSQQDVLNVNLLVDMGEKRGYTFDAAELNQAYCHEWTMRWMHDRSRQHNR